MLLCSGIKTAWPAPGKYPWNFVTFSCFILVLILYIATMDLNINILRSPPRSITKKVLGTLYILLAILWFVVRIMNNEPDASRSHHPFLDIVYILLFGFSGVVFLIEGSGISIGRWFGEAYIKIDSEMIFIKRGVFSKEWKILWREVEEVQFKVIKIRFAMKDKSYMDLDYDNLPYEHIQELKRTVKTFSGEKNIKIL